MLACAGLATPSNAAARPSASRGKAIIDTRNRTDVYIVLQTDPPTLARKTPASRKPNKTADPPADELSSLPFTAPNRAQQPFWAASFLPLLLGAFGVLLSEWMWPPRSGAASGRRSNSGRLVRCRTVSCRGAWLILVALLPLACALSPPPSTPPPPGSTCENAMPFDGAGAASFVIDIASTDAGPGPSGAYNSTQCQGTYFNPDATGRAFWLRLTDVRPFPLELHTCAAGTSFDTDLSVFTGSCDALRQVACNGDGQGLSGCAAAYYSRITGLQLSEGERYWVVVGGYDGATGAVLFAAEYQIPPPSLPPLPPLPPLLPIAPSFVAAASEDELRSLVEGAAANVSVYLRPGADFKLFSQIRCTSTIKVTVASSDEGATLDGQGETGLFKLENGCSLTLRGLTLVKGMADHGGVVEANGAGDIEIIESTSGGVVYAHESGAVSISGSNVMGCSAGKEGGVVDARSSGAVSITSSNVTDCFAGYGGVVHADDSGAVSIIDSDFGGVVYAYDSGGVSIIGSSVTGCSAVYDGGATLTWDSDLIVTDSTIFGCNATQGGAVYVASGTASLARSTISNCIATEFGGGLYSAGGSTSLSHGTFISGCSALSGGGLYLQGGSTSLSDGTLISGCSAKEEGSSIFLFAGKVSYALPAPAGRWLPNARCEVYREACPTNSGVPINDCPNHREDCALILDVRSEWHCQAPTFVQPCNWNNETGGDPSLLGLSLYRLPLIPVEQDFPFACAAGLLGSADPEYQSSSSCAGPCSAGSKCPKEATYEALPCDAGHYCPQGTSVPLSCPPGSYSNSTDLTAASECTDASPGHFAITGSTEQTPCAKGSYAATGGLSECEPCEGGTYQHEKGATGCLACEKGSYCTKGTSVPLPCPAGSYSSATNLTAASECTAASPGHFATTGSTQQTPCAKGSYTDAYRQSEGTPCAGGTYQDAEAQTGCKPCDKGSYCAVGASVALPCEAGSYTDKTNLTEASECTQCPAGRYQPERGQSSCISCATGGYCDSAETCGGGFTPCKAGTYNDMCSARVSHVGVKGATCDLSELDLRSQRRRVVSGARQGPSPGRAEAAATPLSERRHSAPGTERYQMAQMTKMKTKIV